MRRNTTRETMLYLDYYGSATPFPWAGAAVLAAGLALAAGVAMHYRATLAQTSYWENQAGVLEQTSRRHASLSQHERNEMALEIRHANDVLGQITLPWDSLFQAVEGSAGKDVALLTIEPDAERHQVKISGEAKNMAAVLDYMAHLSAQEALSGVYLQNHRVQRRVLANPVRFALVVTWKMAL